MAHMTLEAGQDLKAYLNALTVMETIELFENTIKDNGFSTLRLERNVVPDTKPQRYTSTIIFVK